VHWLGGMTPAVEEPPPSARRALTLHTPTPAGLVSILSAWNKAGRTLFARCDLSGRPRDIIRCQRGLCDELFEFGDCGGAPAGELRVAFADGRPHWIAALEPLERSVFIHYLVSAPWNALTADDVTDLRTMRGACVALIEDAVRRSAARGLGGVVWLEAINDQCRSVYQHLGFARASIEELPGTFPLGLYSAAEASTRCWMLLDAARSERFGAVVCSRPKAA
jgi:hypothetical protein